MAEEIPDEMEEIKTKLIDDFSCYPVFLSQKDVESYWNEFCNKTIWPLFHYFTQYTTYRAASWETYNQINKKFCNAIVEDTENAELFWIHDYHLMLLPKLLRERIQEPIIGFFLHIPFPSFEIYRLLPWRKEILRGLTGADVVGFHTYDYARHFLTSVHHLLGIETKAGQAIVKDRMVKVDSFPMGIDYERYSRIRKEAKVQKEISRIRKKTGNIKVIFSIDRLDYTKGIPQRLEAFDLFLETYPEFKEKVKLICVAVPSRINVDDYMELKKQVDELVGRINGKHGTLGWNPIWYLYQYLPFTTLAALYSIADIALITPIRDGMNLIAKEFIASKLAGKGVLILSETAGAAKELGEAIQINVNNKRDIAEALKKALLMKEKIQKKRNRIMQKRLKRYNVEQWAQDFLNVLVTTKDFQKEVFIKFLSFEKRKELIERYLKSDQKLIFLNYEGTLVSKDKDLEKLKPSTEILAILRELVNSLKTKVVLVSELTKDLLDKWFGRLNLDLVAEHGIWIKEQGNPWEMIEPLTNSWKDEIHPILDLYTTRTPESLIKEEEFSLEWDYHRTDSELGLLRARELRDFLMNFTGHYNLQIIERNKNIKIRNASINKGRAAIHWLSQRSWDFILAVGCDWTDEALFTTLPQSAYSVRVGLEASQATYNVPLPSDVQIILNDMIKQMPYKYQIKQLDKQISGLDKQIGHLDLVLSFKLDYYSKSYWKRVQSTLIEKRTRLKQELVSLDERMRRV